MSDENDTVPRYMYDQVQVAYQKQRERTRKLRQEHAELRALLERQQQEPATNADDWLRSRYGSVRGHAAWRELIEAFNAGAAAERARILAMLREMHEEARHRHNTYAYAANLIEAME